MHGPSPTHSHKTQPTFMLRSTQTERLQTRPFQGGPLKRENHETTIEIKSEKIAIPRVMLPGDMHELAAAKTRNKTTSGTKMGRVNHLCVDT